MYANWLQEPANLTVALPLGGSVTLRPVQTVTIEAAKAATRKKVAEILADTEKLKALGLDPEQGLLADAREGLFMGILSEELGVRLIVSWEGVADISGEKAADVTAENIRKLMRCAAPARAVYTAVIEAQLPAAIQKKDLRTAADGSSAAVPVTAPAADK